MHASHGQETILVVEDDESILKPTRKKLGKHGYCLPTASTPALAVLIASSHSRKIDLLMTDVIMPEMNGHDLAGTLLSLYPKLK